MPAPRSTSRASRARWPKASGARAKSSLLAPRARRWTVSVKRRRGLVFPDDADDDALHDDVALVEAQRLQRVVGGLQPDPPTGLAVESLDRGAFSVDERDHRLAGVGLVSLLNDDIVAVLDVLVDHRVAANLQDIAATAPGQELVGYRDGLVAGHGFDGGTGGDEPEQRQLGRAGLALGGHDLDRGTLIVGAPDVALALEIREMLVHRGQRLEPKLAGDFLEARGVPLLSEVFRNEVEDLALAPRDRHTGSRRFTEP